MSLTKYLSLQLVGGYGLTHVSTPLCRMTRKRCARGIHVNSLGLALTLQDLRTVLHPRIREHNSGILVRATRFPFSD